MSPQLFLTVTNFQPDYFLDKLGPTSQVINPKHGSALIPLVNTNYRLHHRQCSIWLPGVRGTDDKERGREGDTGGSQAGLQGLRQGQFLGFQIWPSTQDSISSSGWERICVNFGNQVCLIQVSQRWEMQNLMETLSLVNFSWFFYFNFIHTLNHQNRCKLQRRWVTRNGSGKKLSNIQNKGRVQVIKMEI